MLVAGFGDELGVLGERIGGGERGIEQMIELHPTGKGRFHEPNQIGRREKDASIFVLHDCR